MMNSFQEVTAKYAARSLAKRGCPSVMIVYQSLQIFTTTRKMSDSVMIPMTRMADHQVCRVRENPINLGQLFVEPAPR